MSDAKRELTDFLMTQVFEPVMKARPEGRSEAEQRKLNDLQKATAAEIERYRHYGSAREVVTNFRRDLSSAPAKRVHAELEALKLPTINEIRDDFEAKARRLGVV